MDKKSYDKAVMAAFNAELKKHAGVLGTVGGTVMKGLAGGAKMVGQNARYGRFLQAGHKMFGGAEGLHRAVGGATLVGGGALGAGFLAGRASR